LADSVSYTMKDDSGSCFELTSSARLFCQPLALWCRYPGRHSRARVRPTVAHCDGDGFWAWIPLSTDLELVRMLLHEVSSTNIGTKLRRRKIVPVSARCILACSRPANSLVQLYASIASATAARNTTASSSAAATAVRRFSFASSIKTLIATVWSWMELVDWGLHNNIFVSTATFR
jgi:hypothetical protein